MDENMVLSVILVVGNFIECYLAFVLLSAFFKESKARPLWVVVVVSTGAIILSVINLSFGKNSDVGSILAILFIIAFFAVVGLLLFEREKLYKYFLIAMLFTVIVMIVETFGVLILLVFGIGLEEGISNPNYYLLMFTLTKVLEYFIIVNLNYSRLKKRYDETSPYDDRWYYICLKLCYCTNTI